MRARALEIIAELGFDLHPDRKVRRAVARASADGRDRQGVAHRRPAADPRRADRLADRSRRPRSLFELVAKLKASGVGIIYVSHRMREIKQIADRITVLRDGRKITTVNAGDVSENELVELMTGRKIGVLFPAHRSPPGRKAAGGRAAHARRRRGQRGQLLRARRRDHRHRRARRLRQIGARARGLWIGDDRLRRDPRRRRGDAAPDSVRLCCRRGSATFRRTASPRAWRWAARCARTPRWRRSICRHSRAAACCGARASGAPFRGSSKG